MDNAKQLVALADEQYNRGSFGAARVNYLEAVEQLQAEVERLREQVGSVNGWREFDWPEKFDRRSAELVAENMRRIAAIPGPDSIAGQASTCGVMAQSPQHDKTMIAGALIPAPSVAEPAKCGTCKDRKRMQGAFGGLFVDCPDCTPASAGQAKCGNPECVNGSVPVVEFADGIPYQSGEPCPDCTPASAEQMCVCKIRNNASICGEAFDGANNKCLNRVAGEEFCEHPRACHGAEK